MENKLPKCDIGQCCYSRSRDQPYPRRCTYCGTPENSPIDHEKVKISQTVLFDIKELTQLLQHIHYRNNLVVARRNSLVPETIDSAIEHTNKLIKTILNL